MRTDALRTAADRGGASNGICAGQGLLAGAHPAHTRGALRQLALAMDAELATSLPIDQAERTVEQYLADHSAARDILDEALGSSITTSRHGRVAFSHDLLGRFLAADSPRRDCPCQRGRPPARFPGGNRERSAKRQQTVFGSFCNSGLICMIANQVIVDFSVAAISGLNRFGGTCPLAYDSWRGHLPGRCSCSRFDAGPDHAAGPGAADDQPVCAGCAVTARRRLRRLLPGR